MAVFSWPPFVVIAPISFLLVIWMVAPTAAEAASPSCSLPSPPSSSSSRSVKCSAGDGRRRSLASDRGKLLRDEALIGKFSILNTTILSSVTELIEPNAIVPRPPDLERHVWAMALSPAPPDDSLFFIVSDRIYKLRLNVGPGQEDVTAIAGPWNNTDNVSVAIGMAMEDPDLAGSGSASTDSSSLSRGRILHVADCSNFILRAFAVNGTELFSRSYRGLFPGNESEPYNLEFCIRWLAIDHGRHLLYASSRTAIYRTNLSSEGGETPSYPPLEHWIGPRVIANGSEGPGFRDSQDPLEVRFNSPRINPQAISEDGQVIYVADVDNHCIRRIHSATGMVDTIAGRNGRRGSEDGPALSATFNGPMGLALTRDGCNLFVAEFLGEPVGPDYVGRVRLIELSSTGEALVVRTDARLQYNWDAFIFLSAALSRDEDRLYIGRGDMQITELRVIKEALFSCHAPPDVSAAPPDVSAAPPDVSAAPPDVSAAAPDVRAAPNDGNDGRSQDHVIIVTTVTLTVVALLLLVGAFIGIRRRRGMIQRYNLTEVRRGVSAEMPLSGTGDSTHSSQGGQPGVLVRPSSALKQYSWEELAKACDGFSPSRLVGKGGAAEVYRGELADGQKVAIKMMKGAEFSESRFRQFQAELDVLTTLRHMHLCSIIGYGAHQSKSFIVYPFVEGGTLYDCLQGTPPPEPNLGDAAVEPKRHPLSWGERLSIARQVAKALRYLHEEVDPPVIHRDVKSKNVLLEYGGRCDSVKIRAYLSDFGLAKLGQSAFSSTPPLLEGPAGNMTDIDLAKFETTGGYSVTVTQSGDTIQTLNVAGTRGYMAPEYMRSCWLTYKNDVYAFGVVLLELITGRKAFGRMDTLPGQQQDDTDRTKGTPENLTFWAKRRLRSLECLSASDEDEGSRAYTRTGVVATSPLRSNPSTKRAYSMKFDGVQELADPQLESNGGFKWREMAAVVKLALECVRTNPKRRPKMGEVLERLNRVEDGRS